MTIGFAFGFKSSAPGYGTPSVLPFFCLSLLFSAFLAFLEEINPGRT
jgi:hypothetical protein